MKDIFRKILESPEHVRKKFLMLSIFVIAPLIFGIWIYSLKLNLQKLGQEPANKKSFYQAELWQDFSSGLANMKEIFAGIGINPPKIFEGDSFGASSEPERPRVYIMIPE
jgi:cytosine/uracil/thiamine/allantoin permease